jgi:hypothetical protein
LDLYNDACGLFAEPGGATGIIGKYGQGWMSVGSLYFHNVHEDKFGNIWFGTANGLHKRSSVRPLQAVSSAASFHGCHRGRPILWSIRFKRLAMIIYGSAKMTACT